MDGIHIQLACKSKGIPARKTIRNWVTAALGNREPAELTVRIVDLPEGTALNHRWRGADHATNVLAFPVSGLDDVAPGLLGDIVVCAPVVAREAADQHKDPAAHWAHIVVHGVLHLLGHEHEREKDAERMEARERSILRSLGYPDPYTMEIT